MCFQDALSISKKKNLKVKKLLVKNENKKSHREIRRLKNPKINMEHFTKCTNNNFRK
jgi:hypothetical protein